MRYLLGLNVEKRLSKQIYSENRFDTREAFVHLIKHLSVIQMLEYSKNILFYILKKLVFIFSKKKEKNNVNQPHPLTRFSA